MQIDVDWMKYKDRLQQKTIDGKKHLFDPIRQQWMVRQPEELVRLLVVYYLIEEKRYPSSLIAVEHGLKFNNLPKRFDILTFKQDGSPFLMVECKAPKVPVNQEVLWQISWYNMSFKVPYLLVTNGVTNFCCEINYEDRNFNFLSAIPDFSI